MNKTKKILKCCISFFLSLTLVIQFMLNYSVSASVSSGTPGANLPYHTTLKANKTISWTIARKIFKIIDENNDDLDLTWAENYFHNQVEKKIGGLHGAEVEKPTCHYTKSYSDGKTSGRADLSKVIGGYRYIWEVKPVVYCLNTTLRENTFENQLDRYIDSNPTYRNGCKSGISFGKDTFTSKEKLFSITYEDAGNGLIVYTFDFLWDKIKDSVPDEIWLTLIYPLFKELTSSSPSSNNNNNPVPVDVIADEFAEISAAAIVDAFNQLWKQFEGENANSINVPKIANDAYYIEEEQLLRLQQKLDNLIITTGIAAIFSKLVIEYNTSIGSIEDAKLTLEATISNLLTNYKPQIIGGCCYYMLSSSDVDVINIFKETFDNYESYDPYSEEWDFGIIAGEEFVKNTSSHIESINNNISKLSFNYEEAQNQYQRDPLIINFSGTDDVEFTSLSDGVNFDLDNNEFAEKTAWIKNNDGFLAIDLNSNGKIDNGGELFGDSFIMPDGNCSKTGFEALSSLDTNKNDKIDAEDAMFENALTYTNEEEKNLFDQLIVWFDNNHNGITDEGDELSSLNSLNIDYIDLKYTNDTYDADDNIPEEKGARQEGKSYVYFNDETNEKSISEFWFKVNNSTTIHDGEITVGNVKNIEQAIADDETGTLYGLCLAFNYSTDIAEKRCLLKKILYFITNSSDIEIGSRGGNIDARDLHVVEAFMGHEFIGVDGRNPNAPAAEMLKDIYRSIEDRYYCIINLKMSFGGYMTVTFDDEDVNGDKYLNIELLNVVIDEMAKENDPEADILIYDLGVYLKIYDNVHGTKCFDSYKEHYLAKSPKYQEIVELIGNSYTYIDTEGDDTYSGSVYNDFVFGESGNNELNGSSGNDRIYSGFGDDLLQGGEGDDRYYFGIYHGNDVVKDTNGNNQIIFIDGYSIDDYDISFTLDGKFVLINKYTEDSITLNDFIAYPDNYEFISNNENSTIGGGEAREIIEGTDDDDELDASDGFNVFYGKNGNDTIDGGMDIDFMYGGNGDDILLGRNGINAMFGESGNDIIYDGDDSGYLNGGDGEDMLYGGGSTDILDGGAGNDYLQGDHGNDTYIFGKGYDIDTIAASSDLHTIIIHNYSVNDMHNTREMNNDLVIDLGNETGDRIIVKAFFDFNANRDYCFIFDDDTVLGQYDITAKSAPIYGTEEDDYLRGTDEIDTLDGGAGDDNLCGNNGEDTYIFGKDYAHDIINEWGDDHSFVEFKDINSNEITVSNQWESNLIISVNDTEDILTISNFKWGQASYTFKFADGAEGYVDKNTWELVLTKQPDPIEEDISENTTVLSDSDIETNIVNETIIESENAIEQDSDAEIEETSDIDNDLVA